jgi:hypothetical protein
MSRFLFLFSNLHNLLSAIENDQFWQKPTSFPDLTNQNVGIQIYANWKKESKNVTVLFVEPNNKIRVCGLIYAIKCS